MSSLSREESMLSLSTRSVSLLSCVNSRCLVCVSSSVCMFAFFSSLSSSSSHMNTTSHRSERILFRRNSAVHRVSHYISIRLTIMSSSDINNQSSLSKRKQQRKEKK